MGFADVCSIQVTSLPYPQHHSALKSASFHSFLEGITAQSVKREKHLIWSILLQRASWEENRLGKYLLSGCSLILLINKISPFMSMYPRPSNPASLFPSRALERTGGEGSQTRSTHEQCEESQETTSSQNEMSQPSEHRIPFYKLELLSGHSSMERELRPVYQEIGDVFLKRGKL